MNVGFIKEVFSNMPHAMIIKTENGAAFKSITEYGKSIEKSINIKAGSIDEQLPIGFSFTGFIENSSNLKTLMNNHFADEMSEVDKIITKTQKTKFSERKIIFKENTHSSITSSKIPNNLSLIQRNNAIRFKVKAFIAIKKKAGIGASLRSGHVSIDQFSRNMQAKKDSVFAEILIDSMKAKYGKSMLRKTLSSGQIVPSGNQSRRAMRRSRSLAPVNNSVKHANVATRINVAVAKAGF